MGDKLIAVSGREGCARTRSRRTDAAGPGRERATREVARKRATAGPIERERDLSGR